MNEAIQNWMQANPRVVWAMSLPILLFLGHALVWNRIVRWSCAAIAGATMLTVVVFSILTQQWAALGPPVVGGLIWMIIVETAREHE